MSGLFFNLFLIFHNPDRKGIGGEKRKKKRRKKRVKQSPSHLFPFIRLAAC